MPDLVEGLVDWAANKTFIAPALQLLVDDGDLTLANDRTIEQAADKLLNAILEFAGKHTPSAGS